MLQEDDVLPSQRGRRLKGEGKGIERNAKREERPSRFSSSNRASIFVSTSCEERHNIPFRL